MPRTIPLVQDHGRYVVECEQATPTRFRRWRKGHHLRINGDRASYVQAVAVSERDMRKARKAERAVERELRSREAASYAALQAAQTPRRRTARPYRVTV